MPATNSLESCLVRRLKDLSLATPDQFDAAVGLLKRAVEDADDFGLRDTLIGIAASNGWRELVDQVSTPSTSRGFPKLSKQDGPTDETRASVCNAIRIVENETVHGAEPAEVDVVHMVGKADESTPKVKNEN